MAARLAPLLPAHGSLLVGLSGGMDSVVLLHLLHSLASRQQWRLSALHVHHGISPNADAWARFCGELCARHGIPLIIENVDITPLRTEHGIEAAARKLRYAAFARQQCDLVALAQHAGDQSETLLLQLLRGAGVKGGASMPLYRTATAHAPAIVRPLLDVPRSTLLDYAQQHGLGWVEDESNADVGYPRNFLRHRVLPLLQQRFPTCEETLARSARHLAEADGLLDDLARLDVADGLAGGVLQVARLQALSPARARNLLRYFLHEQGAPMPHAAQLDDMLNQLCGAREDAVLCVEFGGRQLRRYRGGVYVLPAAAGFDRDHVVAWQGEPALGWPALAARVQFTHATGAGVSLAKLQQAPVTLRLRRGGETLRPHPDAATRSLKNLLQEYAVPPWLRERLPLLYCGDVLVCVVGVAIQAEYQAQNGEAGITPFCQ